MRRVRCAARRRSVIGADAATSIHAWSVYDQGQFGISMDTIDLGWNSNRA